MTVYLTLDELLAIINEYGLQSVRDVGLLDSAAHRPRTTVLGEDAYPTLDEKAAVMLESIVRHHPLIDGNERLGWLATYVFYGRNGVTLDAPFDNAYDLVIGVATGDLDYHRVAATLLSWITEP